MLDACADLIDEIGYEALTTTLIAERAGVAIGSVYQFFPDKRAVVQALRLRNLEAYLDRLTHRMSSQTAAREEPTHWWDVVEASIDEYVAMHRTVPGFRTLHLGDLVDGDPLDEERDASAVIAEHLGRLLAARVRMAHARRLGSVLTVAVEAAHALVRLAFRRALHGDEAVLTEAKTLVRGYLNVRLRG
jgi:AcrR family transcriptional regulator